MMITTGVTPESTVPRDITAPGTYLGTPARRV